MALAGSGVAGDAPRPRRVLVVSPFAHDGWKWLSDYFPPERYSWQFINLNLFGKKQPAWAMAAWKAAAHATAADLVVSHHPYMTLWLAAALRARRIRKPHLAFSFNHGNKRFFSGPLLMLAKRVFPDVDLFNVLSGGERLLFNRLYDIPLEKLRFSHWAVGAPVIHEPLAEGLRAFQPYICAMGRNNRDFPTLLDATEGLPVNVLIVGTPQNVAGLPERPNVRIKTDISLDESMQILAGSLFSVVPLKDNSTGAGHMTFVHAMHLQKPQVATDVQNTEDYFVDPLHGFRVPVKDAGAMREAIRRLVEDRDLRERVGREAKGYADRWLSEEAAARTAQEVLDDWYYGRPYRLAPEGWPEDRNGAG